MTGTFPNLLVVHPSFPVKTVPELVSILKANPGKFAFASSGQGTSLHLSGELFKVMTKTDMLHVPYKGGGPATADVMKEKYASGGSKAASMTPRQFAAFIKAETERWAPVIRASGARVE